MKEKKKKKINRSSLVHRKREKERTFGYVYKKERKNSIID